MNLSYKLSAFREYKNWKQEDIAKELSISPEEYKDLESGLDRIDAETALKLSELYQAPPQFFLADNSDHHTSVIYTHCHFENSNGYVNHLYQHDGELAAKEETIKLLKEDITQLRKENNRLIELLGSKLSLFLVFGISLFWL